MAYLEHSERVAVLKRAQAHNRRLETVVKVSMQPLLVVRWQRVDQIDRRVQLANEIVRNGRIVDFSAELVHINVIRIAENGEMDGFLGRGGAWQRDTVQETGTGLEMMLPG